MVRKVFSNTRRIRRSRTRKRIDNLIFLIDPACFDLPMYSVSNFNYLKQWITPISHETRVNFNCFLKPIVNTSLIHLLYTINNINIRYIFVEQLWQPMPIMIWMAAIVEAGIENFADMAILLFIQFANATIGFYEITKAGDAVAALKASLQVTPYSSSSGQQKASWSRAFSQTPSCQSIRAETSLST